MGREKEKKEERPPRSIVFLREISGRNDYSHVDASAVVLGGGRKGENGRKRPLPPQTGVGASEKER